MKLIQASWLIVLFVAGCSEPPPPATPTPPMHGAPSTTTPENTHAAPPSTQATQNALGVNIDPSGPVGGSTSSPPATPAAEPATETVKAEAGVGAKGQSLEEHTGVLIEPAKAYFRFEQKAVFNIQIPEAMKLFQASEGRKPNSEEEFMTKIIKGNNINLPNLKPGEKYVYNVEQGELMVERPKK